MLIFATKFQNDWDVKGKGHSLYLENKLSLCVEISPLSVKFGKKFGLWEGSVSFLESWIFWMDVFFNELSKIK